MTRNLLANYLYLIFFNENRSKFINLFFRPRHHEGRAPERNHRLAQSVQLRATAVAGDDEHGRVRRKVGVRSSKNNLLSVLRGQAGPKLCRQVYVTTQAISSEWRDAGPISSGPCAAPVRGV